MVFHNEMNDDDVLDSEDFSIIGKKKMVMGE